MPGPVGPSGARGERGAPGPRGTDGMQGDSVSVVYYTLCVHWYIHFSALFNNML